ncbi:hypothetical protein HYW19_02475 [Candidatus Woesearchaeota archaeon]|nr:hypothetical protein [Candidatus Woesearchaeota archaeon]
MAGPFLIVGTVLILFAAFFVFTFFSSASFILNLIIIIALFWRIRTNLSDKDNHKHYLAAILLTALFFIYSGSSFAKSLLELGERLLISNITIAVALIYLFAHIAYNAHKSYPYFKKKIQKWAKTLRKEG